MSEVAAIPPGTDSHDLTGAEGWKIQAGLRFALAFVVVCGHLVRFAPDTGGATRALMKLGQFDAVAAVFCFLVVSGFSIAHSLHRNTEGFYRRRVLRIYPLYVCGILAALVPFLLAGPVISTPGGQYDQPAPGMVIANLLLLQGFVADTISSNGPLWTLSVEVCCYLLAPIFFKMKSWQLLGLILISSVAFGIHARLGLPFYSRYRYGLPVLFLLWAWLSGFLLHRHRSDARARIFVLTLGALLFSLNARFNERFAVLTYVAAISIVLFANELRLPARILGLLNYLGEISYPLYVLHVPVLILASGVMGIANAPLLVMSALLAAVAFYHTVDRPVRKLGVALARRATPR